MPRAAIYARLSEDRTGDAIGIEAQLEDARALAVKRGWTVAREFVDRNISAYSGRTRPAFQAMMQAIQEQHFDAVIAYHQDRLTRSPAEFEEFLTTCDRGGVKQLATVTGLTDLGEGDSVMVARIYSAVARNQSDAASRRIRRHNEQRAKAGLPHISGERAFGYELDRMTIHESEAATIHELAQRFVAGESLSSLVNWLHEQGIRTATGLNEWRTPTLRNLLKSPRIAGLREHRGQVVGPAAWPAIISLETHESIVARLEASARAATRTPRRYLLSGRVRCSTCGAKMVSAPDSGRRRYGCRKGPDFVGCGKVYVNAEPLERLVSDALLLRLSTPDLTERLARKSTTGARDLLERMSLLQRRLDDLAKAYGAGDVDMKEWLLAKGPLESLLAEARQAYAAAADAAVLEDFLGASTTVNDAWTSPTMTLQRQVAVLQRVIDHVVIHPAARKTNRLDPARVEIVWLV